jgi:polyhydroxyalkanoate synthesis regulator protein
MEKAKNKNALLPVPLLHLIIQHGENVLEEFFDKYLEQTLKNYLEYKSAVDEQFRKWLEIGSGFSGMTQRTLANLSPLQTMFNPFHDSSKSQERKKTNK